MPIYAEVVKVPEGGEPLEIREEWMGVVFPVFMELHAGRDYSGALLLHKFSNDNAYAIRLDDALAALMQAGRAEAVVWWLKWCLAKGGFDRVDAFVFDSKALKIVNQNERPHKRGFIDIEHAIQKTQLFKAKALAKVTNPKP